MDFAASADFMRLILSLAVSLACLPATASGQNILDRKVATGDDGQPLGLVVVTPHLIGSLSRAAHIPIGFESLPWSWASGGRREVVLTGLTVREALDRVVAADARYTWREMDRVVVIRPAGAWQDETNPLHAPVPAVRLGETSSREALATVAALLGAPPGAVSFSDTTPFVLDVEAGSMLDLLNAVVRSHGELVWQFHHNARNEPGSPWFPYTMGLMSGPHGSGVGVTGRMPFGAVGVAATADPVASKGSWLDQIVGPGPGGKGNPLVLTGTSPHALWSLSTASGVPMGIEVDSRTPAPVPPRRVPATGRTLRAVVDDLVAGDPRYAWREIDGVVVIRPVGAWSDPQDPLFSIVADVHLENRPMTEIVRAVVSALGGFPPGSFADGKRTTVSAWQPTALDLLNALVRAHNLLVWAYEDADPDEVQRTGLQHRLTLYLPGGSGFGTFVR